MYRRIVVGAALAPLLGSPALAKGLGKGDGEVGFDLGATNFDSNVSDETGVLIGFRGGYCFTEVFELEGQIAASATEQSGVDITLQRTMVNAVLNMHPKETIVPYFLPGVGAAKLTVESPFGDTDETDLAYQGGFGSRFFFGRKGSVAFRIELSVPGESTFDESSTHTSLAGGFMEAIIKARAGPGGEKRCLAAEPARPLRAARVCTPGSGPHRPRGLDVPP